MNDLSKGLCFEVENLGIIRGGEFTQKPLTVFCGPNNSGKTWAMYSLYYFYRLLPGVAEVNIHSESRNSRTTRTISLKRFNEHMSTSLADLFNTSLKELNSATFRLKVTDSDWQHIVDKAESTTRAFLMPAERNGLHLFFRELSTRRTALLHHASREKIDISELLRDVIHSRYALPIADYINWLNELPEKQKLKSNGFHEHALLLKKNLVGGAYRVDARSGVVQFKPYQPKRDGIKTNFMGLHMTSGMVKSLFGLWFYLENQASEGSVLMIDEPELNIHPASQRYIARLLVRLVNAGLNIVISTHSDYIVRELNSLIMLSGDKNQKLGIEHGYDKNEVLSIEQVGAYLFDNQTITPFEITPGDGIYATTFDEVISDINTTNDDIYYSLQEQSDVQSDD